VVNPPFRESRAQYKAAGVFRLIKMCLRPRGPRFYYNIGQERFQVISFGAVTNFTPRLCLF